MNKIELKNKLSAKFDFKAWKELLSNLFSQIELFNREVQVDAALIKQGGHIGNIRLDLLGWIKTRKGFLSLTAKGKKALTNIDNAANEILLFSLIGVGLHTFDGYEEDQIGNLGMAYSVWLLNKYGSEWHLGDFYKELYKKAFNFPGNYNAYETRVFSRLFCWLGIVEHRLNKHVGPPFEEEYKKTDLLSMIFSFKRQSE